MTRIATVLLVLFLSNVALGDVEEYVLQPGDVISITVVEHPEFSGQQKIRPDGRINYPVIGEIDVATLTCAQLVKIMQGKLSSYVNNPVVSVAIDAYFANKVYAIGDLGHAGPFEVYEPLDILKAIAICGGLNNPKIGVIKIIRGDGTIVNVYMKDVWGSPTKRDPKKYLLYPGDALYVPPSFKFPWGYIMTVVTTISACIGFYFLIVGLPTRK